MHYRHEHGWLWLRQTDGVAEAAPSIHHPLLSVTESLSCANVVTCKKPLKEVETSDAAPCAKLASFAGRPLKESGRGTGRKGCEEGKQLNCIEEGCKWGLGLETFMDVAGVLHLLQTSIAASDGKSNATGFLYSTKPVKCHWWWKGILKVCRYGSQQKYTGNYGFKIHFWIIVP